MSEFIPPNLRDPRIAYGIISGFPVHESYPIENRAALDKLFREDYYAWEAMRKAADRHGTVRDPEESRPSVQRRLSYCCVDGWWEYKGKRFVDRGFILLGESRSL